MLNLLSADSFTRLNAPFVVRDVGVMSRFNSNSSFVTPFRLLTTDPLLGLPTPTGPLLLREDPRRNSKHLSRLIRAATTNTNKRIISGEWDFTSARVNETASMLEDADRRIDRAYLPFSEGIRGRVIVPRSK